MNRYKNTLRFILTLVTTLIVAVAPFLQATQLSQMNRVCSESCCCGCNHEQNEVLPDVDLSLNGSCCCKVSSPATETAVPLEAQLLPNANVEAPVVVVTEPIPVTVIRNKPRWDIASSLQQSHGPPIFILNASFLI